MEKIMSITGKQQKIVKGVTRGLVWTGKKQRLKLLDNTFEATLYSSVHNRYCLGLAKEIETMLKDTGQTDFSLRTQQGNQL